MMCPDVQLVVRWYFWCQPLLLGFLQFLSLWVHANRMFRAWSPETGKVGEKWTAECGCGNLQLRICSSQAGFQRSRFCDLR